MKFSTILPQTAEDSRILGHFYQVKDVFSAASQTEVISKITPEALLKQEFLDFKADPRFKNVVCGVYN